VPADSVLRREGHPRGLRKVYEIPEDIADEAGSGRRWTFGVAAGALLVAGTVAAGALGLNGSALPVAGETAPEHAPTSPGNGPHDIGTPAVAAPPHGEHHKKPQPRERAADAEQGSPAAGAQAPGTAGGVNGGSSGAGGSGGQGGVATPAPAPAPAPGTSPAPRPGPVEKVVTPVTDTVGDIVEPVSGTVGGILSPVTGALRGGGEQPAMTMINPLGDLLGQ
jgi:hypothetical protein